ncbi:MAG: hypothetical protein WKF43_10105 [Acidimicrobiales bacterium]
MYALVMVLSLAAWLVADDALDRPTPGRLAGLAVLTGCLLWTHYWAMWLRGGCARPAPPAPTGPAGRGGRGAAAPRRRPGGSRRRWCPLPAVGAEPAVPVRPHGHAVG